jgi:hypothetical protein
MNINIPLGDFPEFAALRPKIRQEVDFWINLIGDIEDSKPVLPAIQRAKEKFHISQATIFRKRKDYKTYGWRGLINRAKHPSNLPPASSETFLRFVYALWMANNKNYVNTHLQLVAMWKGRAPIPGYEELPSKSPFKEFPAGWTYGNIHKHIKDFAENHPEPLASQIRNLT